MRFNQGIINVLRTRIHSIQPNEYPGVVIRTEHHTHTFPGCYVLPGLVDSHLHVVGLGMTLSGLTLFGLRSIGECIYVIKKFAESGNNLRGDWITGMGWNQELWSDSRMPTRQELDEHFPDVPVYLRRADGHSAWVNSEALRRAGITTSTPNPNGGEILRESSGQASGVLIDNAMELVANLLPDYSEQQLESFILTALNDCAKKGLTEVHDMDVPIEYVQKFRTMAESGVLPCRVISWIRGQNWEWKNHGLLPAGGEYQQTKGVKFFADGALGSRGAALIEPYSDAPTHGLFLLTHEELYERCKLALEQGFHCSTHAIGDAANRMTLDVYGRLRSEGIADKDTLLRIEHSQIVHPDDVGKFKQYDITAPVQAIHCTSDATMAESRLGERCNYAYPWLTLQNLGITMSGGSDAPIESNDPIKGIHAFCYRRANGTNQPWYPNEIINRKDAISAYTINAHKAGDVAYRRGIIKQGMDADFTILDRDIYQCDEEELLETKIIATISGGIIRYIR